MWHSGEGEAESPPPVHPALPLKSGSVPLGALGLAEDTFL